VVLVARHIGTLVERTTRFTMLLHLPRLKGLAKVRMPRTDLRSRDTELKPCAMRSRAPSSPCPKNCGRSLTWDQGTEMAQHSRLKIDAGIQVYFCDPRSPWQRGTNENTTGCSDNTSRKAQI